ncbi:BON domain-containing protein [Planctomicrobium piriforme]|uniref:Osmotically-inducible protein OsmY, contains BON domain n=1 Tax=Planctomicrobium piriforme TaxID=1576369 RepID=A0A1I3GWT6_9PLAN|nr:BON domain-containing protein [Planctomicrobium piriforme]SFI27859.1 Osmotically-inducible protein OsmY, contains BON domain [Planctomicrobium piriforme]
MLLPRKWALSLGLLAAVPGLTVAGPMDFLKGSPDAAATTPERANQEVADDIGKALGQAKLAYKDVSIEYLAGTATIKGQIKDASQRAMVTRIISEVPGVRTVENKLTLIEGAGAPAARPVSAASHEAAQAAAAHEAAAAPVQHAAGMQAASKPRVQQVNHETAAPQSNQAVAQGIADALTSAGLSGYDIEIRYKSGVASLIGSVDAKEQAVMAQRATMSVPGVTQVLNRLTVNGQPVNIPPTAGAPGYGPAPGMPPQGMAQGGPQGAVPAGYQQGYGAPPQGYGPPPGMPMQGYGPPPGMPPQGAPIQQAQGMAPGGMQAPMPQYGNVQQTGHHIYNQPNMPNYAWPTYAPYDNSAAISYPTQYDASAFPYIGPYYPYPQVPLGWRKSTLEWDDGYWSLKFDSKTDRWWWFLNPHNWH